MTLLSSIHLGLLVGKSSPRPAKPALLNAIQSVTVNQSDDGSAGFSQGFQFVLTAERQQAASKEYALLADSILQPGNRVIITVAIQGKSQVLSDGIITQHQLQFSGKGGAVLTVQGKDLSVMMDLEEIQMAYEEMTHADIVKKILGKYQNLGLKPAITQPDTSWEKEFVQKGTDRACLKRLARQHGFIFAVRPGREPGNGVAYWGPPPTRDGDPQPALSVNMGTATNVESINFTYDALKATQVTAAISLPNEQKPQEVALKRYTWQPDLARANGLTANGAFVRQIRIAYPDDSLLKAKSQAQAAVNKATSQTITCNGTLDVLRYGGLLTAPGIVGVRGVGEMYDGNYYVQQATHQINVGSYKQTFTLTREGTGTRVQTVKL